MQDLNRNLPALIFEYAFYPNGENKFHFVSEASREVLGLEPEALMRDASLINTVVIGDSVGIFSSAPEAGDGTPACECILKIEAKGTAKDLRVTYADQRSSSGVVVRRGVAQLTSVRPVLDPQRYEELLDRLPIGVVIHRGGSILFANKHAHTLAGANGHRELIGLNATDFVDPKYHSEINERIRQVSAGDAVPMVEEKFVRLDGRVIDVETLAFPFLYNNKPAVQVIFRDITGKKRAEAMIRKSETMFRQLFENLPMAVVMLDECGKVTEINPGFEQMFGYSREELRGRNLNDFIVPDNLRSEGIDLNNLITSNRAVTIESIRRHKSGELINVILCGVPVIFDNQAIGIYGVYVNITDRKRVEEELKVRNAELDNFVYKVSHDLRAPLSSVLGLVNLSKLEGNTDSPMQYIELIGEKILALDNFIGDVLSHSKNLKMDVTIDRVDLHKIIDQTFTDLGYLKGVRETNRSVKIEGIEFFSDHWRVSEIFRNLISNAIKYRRPEADDSEISIRITIDHLCADISFSDNGIGISDASLTRIFEMFYRATEQAEGSGIGLYIVKNAVEKLGGQIRVASKPNEGTRFHIVLPNRIGSRVKEDAAKSLTHEVS